MFSKPVTGLVTFLEHIEIKITKKQVHVIILFQSNFFEDFFFLELLIFIEKSTNQFEIISNRQTQIQFRNDFFMHLKTH